MSESPEMEQTVKPLDKKAIDLRYARIPKRGTIELCIIGRDDVFRSYILTNAEMLSMKVAFDQAASELLEDMLKEREWAEHDGQDL